jgi:hypothetical protein
LTVLGFNHVGRHIIARRSPFNLRDREARDLRVIVGGKQLHGGHGRPSGIRQPQEIK